MMNQCVAGSVASSRGGRVAAPPPVGIVVPTINFTAGASSTHDLTQYVPGWSGTSMLLAVRGTTLPASVTFNGTHLVYDGTGSTTSVSGVKLIVKAK